MSQLKRLEELLIEMTWHSVNRDKSKWEQGRNDDRTKLSEQVW